jgi:hypothetical protein
MDQVLGRLKDGRIVLDEQPDWPEGQRVWVMPGLDDEPPGMVLPRVRLPDGRKVPIDDSPEHLKLLAEQMGEGETMQMTEDEERRFYEALDEVNARYGNALKRMAE